MTSTHEISSEQLAVSTVKDIIEGGYSLSLSESTREKIIQCRKYLDEKVLNANRSIYGINTGFGSLYDRNIHESDLEKLQNNLVRSHACGTGDRISPEIVKIMLLLKIQSLSYGHSGVQVDTVERLVYLFNNDLLPVIYEFGSLGASGDLAPLAHLSLPLINEGEYHQGPASELNKQHGLNPIHLKSKEGLALLNGTQFMSAIGTWSLIHSRRLLKLANTIGALSLDVFDGRIEPFEEIVHQIRPHKGQLATAEFVRELLSGSELIRNKKSHVQDPYSFRCIPQVHGASGDAIAYFENIIETEINSVSDNPNVFPEEDRIISAGNFHGQPLALGMDFLCIALSELGNISERRTYQLISGSRNLPNYLVANPGINSGLMIPQYTAASLVSKNKELSFPSSVDSIVSSNGQEDHVSMGANAATKLRKVVENVYSILAIEMMTASQALEFRRPARTSERLERIMEQFRAVVPFIENDRVLHDDITKAEEFVKGIEL